MSIILKFFFVLYAAYACCALAIAEPKTHNKDGIYVSKKQKSFRNVIEARAMGHDTRFKSFPYIENGVYKVVTLYDNPTFIEFEEGEVISTIINPKRSAWQLIPTGNRLFIKPLESDADTELTVMTSKHKYFFEIYAQEPKKDFDEDYTFFFRFRYPNDEETKSIKKYARSVMPDIDHYPEKYNFNYTVTGEPAIQPIKIFDDGEFTYFEFAPTGSIPAVFSVDASGFESIVNFRMIGPYVVAEDVSSRFTLRNGADIVCVFNENAYNPASQKNIIVKKLAKYDYNNRRVDIGVADNEEDAGAGGGNVVFRKR